MQWLTDCKISGRIGGRIGGMPLHSRGSLTNTGQMGTHMDQMLCWGGEGGRGKGVGVTGAKQWRGLVTILGMLQQWLLVRGVMLLLSR